MRSLAMMWLALAAAGCTGDLVELGPKGSTTPGVDMAMGAGGGGGTGGGDMATAVAGPDFGPLTFTKDIQPDIASINMTACLGGTPCGCTNTGCHNAVNNPILSATNAAANYTALVPNEINTTNPPTSILIMQMLPNGGHGGGQKFSGTSDPTYQKWLAWIKQGAPQ